MADWLKRLTSVRRRQAAPATPFEVACRCGEVHRGWRLAERQLLTCSRCGGQVFVLPRSAWPVVEADVSAGTPAPSMPTEEPRIWLMPVLATVVAFVILVVIVAAVLRRFQGVPQRESPAIGEHLHACREALRRGDLAKARASALQAAQLLEQSAGITSAQRAAEVRLLRRQLDLLNDLVDRPVEDLVAEAQSMPAADWQRRWQERYRGRSVAFLVDLWRQPNDAGLHFDYLLPEERGKARIELDDLPEVRERLAVRQAERLFFAARLATLRSEEPDGAWVARLDKGSFVPLDDPALQSSIWLGSSEPGPFMMVDAEARKIAQKLGLPVRICSQLHSGGRVDQWVYQKPDARYRFRRWPGQALEPLSGTSAPPGR